MIFGVFQDLLSVYPADNDVTDSSVALFPASPALRLLLVIIQLPEKHVNTENRLLCPAATEKAVRSFQAKAALEPDGEIGADTWNALLTA